MASASFHDFLKKHRAQFNEHNRCNFESWTQNAVLHFLKKKVPHKISSSLLRSIQQPTLAHLAFSSLIHSNFKTNFHFSQLVNSNRPKLWQFAGLDFKIPNPSQRNNTLKNRKSTRKTNKNKAKVSKPRTKKASSGAQATLKSTQPLQSIQFSRISHDQEISSQKLFQDKPKPQAIKTISSFAEFRSHFQSHFDKKFQEEYSLANLKARFEKITDKTRLHFGESVFLSIKGKFLFKILSILKLF